MTTPVWFAPSRPDPTQADAGSLTPDHIDRMQRSVWLRNVVRDTRLQAVLRLIDSSVDPVAALRHERETNPDFASFCMTLLAIIHGLRLTGATDPDGVLPPSPTTILRRMFETIVKEQQ